MAKAVRQALENVDEKREKMSSLIQDLRAYLSQLNHIHFFTPKEAAPHILCFGIEGIRGEVLVHALEEKDVYVSTTSACSSKKIASSTLQAMKLPSHLAETAIRVSLSEYNTKEEMDRFIEAFDQIYQGFSKILKDEEG